MKESSSLREAGRHVLIVTTAALPWRTGTAVNPLLRAAYVADILKQTKKQVFPDGLTFANPAEQEKWIKAWVEKRTGFDCQFQIKFYAARYDGEGFFSIFPVGDITEGIRDEEADVAILEEPEHLNWFHHGNRWTNKFRHVVGIMHTNYFDYVRRKAPAAAQAIYYVNRRMCSIHCHKVIKLSDAVQQLPRQHTCFCHGVPNSFLEVGLRMRPRNGSQVLPEASSGRKLNGHKSGEVRVQLTTSASGTTHLDIHPSGEQDTSKSERFTKGAYFLGKGVWGKGYTELLDLLRKVGLSSYDSCRGELKLNPKDTVMQPVQFPRFLFYGQLLQHIENRGRSLPVDVYGSGEDMEAIKAKAKENKLDINFHAGIDHLDDTIHVYRAFVNPSTSDVVATTSAEALAMGKWVICPRHPSNKWFEEYFRNALIYDTPEEFAKKLQYAEENNPKPLTEEEAKLLTWEDATQRFLDMAEIKSDEWPGRLTSFRDTLTWPVINAGTGIEAVRRVIGAGRHTAKAPKDLLSFDPANRDLEWDYHLALGYSEPRLL